MRSSRDNEANEENIKPSEINELPANQEVLIMPEQTYSWEFFVQKFNIHGNVDCYNEKFISNQEEINNKLMQCIALGNGDYSNAEIYESTLNDIKRKAKLRNLCKDIVDYFCKKWGNCESSESVELQFFKLIFCFFFPKALPTVVNQLPGTMVELFQQMPAPLSQIDKKELEEKQQQWQQAWQELQKTQQEVISSKMAFWTLGEWSQEFSNFIDNNGKKKVKSDKIKLIKYFKESIVAILKTVIDPKHVKVNASDTTVYINKDFASSDFFARILGQLPDEKNIFTKGLFTLKTSADIQIKVEAILLEAWCACNNRASYDVSAVMLSNQRELPQRTKSMGHHAFSERTKGVGKITKQEEEPPESEQEQTIPSVMLSNQRELPQRTKSMGHHIFSERTKGVNKATKQEQPSKSEQQQSTQRFNH